MLAMRVIGVFLAVLWAVGVPMLHGHAPGLSEALHAELQHADVEAHDAPVTPVAMAVLASSGETVATTTGPHDATHGEANLPLGLLVAVAVVSVLAVSLPPRGRPRLSRRRRRLTAAAIRGSPVSRFEVAIV